jgi:hypothetical protein
MKAGFRPQWLVKTMGPVRPIKTWRLVVLVILVAAGAYSYRANIDIDSFYCDVDDIGGRGACAELRSWITAQAGIVLAQISLSVLLWMARVPKLIVFATLLTFVAATSAMLVAWLLVFFMDVTTYTRSVTFFNERSGVVANLVVLLSGISLTRRASV